MRPFEALAKEEAKLAEYQNRRTTLESLIERGVPEAKRWGAGQLDKARRKRDNNNPELHRIVDADGASVVPYARTRVESLQNAISKLEDRYSVRTEKPDSYWLKFKPDAKPGVTRIRLQKQLMEQLRAKRAELEKVRDEFYAKRDEANTQIEKFEKKLADELQKDQETYSTVEQALTDESYTERRLTIDTANRAKLAKDLASTEKKITANRKKLQKAEELFQRAKDHAEGKPTENVAEARLRKSVRTIEKQYRKDVEMVDAVVRRQNTLLKNHVQDTLDSLFNEVGGNSRVFRVVEKEVELNFDAEGSSTFDFMSEGRGAVKDVTKERGYNAEMAQVADRVMAAPTGELSRGLSTLISIAEEMSKRQAGFNYTTNGIKNLEKGLGIDLSSGVGTAVVEAIRSGGRGGVNNIR